VLAISHSLHHELAGRGVRVPPGAIANGVLRHCRNKGRNHDLLASIYGRGTRRQLSADDPHVYLKTLERVKGIEPSS
jgi:hypothetical protein